MGKASVSKVTAEVVEVVKRTNGKATILTPTVRDRMVRAARAGASNEKMAQFAGVSVQSYYVWRRRAIDAAEAIVSGEEAHPDDLPCLELLEAIHAERSAAVVEAGETIMECLTSSDEKVRLQAAKFFLSTHDPGAWSGKTAAEHRADEANAVKTEAEAVEAVGRASVFARLAEEPGAMSQLGVWLSRRLSGAAVTVDVDVDDDGEG